MGGANTGTSVLFIHQAPEVIGAGFSLVACRIGPLAPDEEMLMTIRFQPSALGEALGVVRIDSNDEDDNPFPFGIRAVGIVGSLVNDDGVGGNWAGALPPAPSDSPESNPLGLDEAQIASYFGLLQSQAPGAEIPGIFALKLGKRGAFSAKLEMAISILSKTRWCRLDR